MRYWLAMPAAGQGLRVGGPVPKQYLEVGGRTLIAWALHGFLADPRCLGVVVATAADDARWAVVRAGLGHPVIEARGGAQRSDSVAAALDALVAHGAGSDDWVLVHDAARPCVSGADIDALLAAVALHPCGGLLAVPLADTLKRAATGEGTVPGLPEVDLTEPRAGLWRALTPQAFRLGPLRAALAAARRAGRAATDEAQAMEWAGHRPCLVAGSATNLKVTTASDLDLAGAILASAVRSGAPGRLPGGSP